MSQQPNIIFIMADDHAAKAISCYGAGINETPNIDRLAQEGIRFNHCYVTNSICTPSRAAILTGTYNHVNCVFTLQTPINNRMPNVAKHLRTGNYQTAVIGKWHLGEGKEHEPSGFDFWSVLPGQGEYFDPYMIEMGKTIEVPGYATDIITEKSLNWMKTRNPEKPFFLMCLHKAPHREWEPHPKNRGLYQEDIAVPETFDDDYKNRARAAKEAKMRIKDDMKYSDLGLVQPEGGSEVGERTRIGSTNRKIPNPSDVSGLRLIDKENGEVFTFQNREELSHFKYQRYLKRYLRTIHSIDESVGNILDYLDDTGLAENTLVIYTSDQGFFLGEHGWYDKRWMFEESFRMPFLIRWPGVIQEGSAPTELIQNIDYAPTFLEVAGLDIPGEIQGDSLVPILKGGTPNWRKSLYYAYYELGEHAVPQHFGVRTDRHKLIFFPLTNEWNLFDLETDPGEMRSVYDQQDYQQVRAEMSAEFSRLREQFDAPPFPSN